MASTGGQLYLWDGQALWAADPSRESDWQSTEGVEQQVSFELVTGDIGQDGAEQRYLSRLTLRLDAACASTVEVALSYDGGPWETVASLTAREARRSYDLPLVPRRHSTLRLRLRGKGQITLRSLAKNLAAAKGGLVEDRRKHMASVNGLNRLGLPKLSENMDPEDARALRSYLYQMQEQLQYVLTNLDVENLSEELRTRLNSL